MFSYSSHNVLSQNLFDLFQTSYFFQTVRHTNFKIKYKLLTYFELLIHQKFQKSVNSTKTVFLVHYKYTIGTLNVMQQTKDPLKVEDLNSKAAQQYDQFY